MSSSQVGETATAPVADDIFVGANHFGKAEIMKYVATLITRDCCRRHIQTTMEN